MVMHLGLKNGPKSVFRHFLENFDQKIAFFWTRASPSKLVYIGAEGTVRKILRSVTKNGYLKLVQRENGRGVESTMKKASAPPPLNSLLKPSEISPPYVCLGGIVHLVPILFWSFVCSGLQQSSAGGIGSSEGTGGL